MEISKNFRKVYNAVIFITILSFITTPTAFSLPGGATVQNGNIIITNPDGSTMNINQMSEQAIIDWIRFCIAHGETVNFIQPNSNSIVLNRITGGSISEIFGALNANGKVWLLNPSGIVFGPSAKINAAGFLASTLNITNEDFLNRAYVFTKSPGSNGYIINKGEIKVKNGGYVALLGGVVINEGVIEAKLGSVVMASGEKMTLELDSEGIISVVINEPIREIAESPYHDKIKDAVLNTGEIIADGGTVILTASVLKDIFENAVNNEGIIRANSLINNKGEVYLLAEGEDARASNKGTIDVSASESGADGGFVEISGDRIGVGGNIDVTSEDGESGTLLLDPYNLYIIDGELLDAYSFLDSTVGELWLENFNGNLTMQAENDVYFLIADNELNLQYFDTETFRVEAGNDINLNDDSIVTQGGDVELFSDVFALDAVNPGVGDVLLGVGGGISTNGGDVSLSGANVNVSAPINTGGGDVDITATANNVIHGARGDVTTGGGNFIGQAVNDYNFRNDSVIDTAGGAFNVTAPNVIFGSPNTQVEYIFSWEYLSGDRAYHFKEFGYYYDDGGLVHVPLAKSFNIGKDGTPLLSGAGIIYGEDFVSLELYTAFEWGGVPFHAFYQDPSLNPSGLDHLQIVGGNEYRWEDILNLGDKDFNDAVMNFIVTRNEYPPETTPTPTVIPQALLWWDLRFKIPKKHLTDLLQVTYTNGPIELLAEQLYFYHPLVDMGTYEMPALGMDFYEFIDGRISLKNPALLPVILGK